jgi:hypothetical protein
VGVTVTPNAGAWVNSAWVQLTASTPNPITIIGVVINPGIASEFEVDIGKGAATSETVVATMIGNCETLLGQNTFLMLFNIPVDNIGGSTRVAVRLRKSGTDVTAWTAKLMYYDQVSVGVTANVPSCAPSAAIGATLTPNAGAWVNSAWAELSASLTDIVVLGIALNPAGTVVSGGTEYEVDIGSGAATSEVVEATFAGNFETYAGNHFLFLPYPVKISGTNRISCRLRKGGTTTTAWTAKILYCSTSDFGAEEMQYTTQPQKILPDGAAMSVLTTTTPAWVNSSWAQLSAGLDSDIVVTDLVTNTATVASEFESEVGKGDATSETVVGTSGASRESTSSAGLPEVTWIGIPIDNIPASTRVAIRFRKSSTTSAGFALGIEYYEKPL